MRERMDGGNEFDCFSSADGSRGGLPCDSCIFDHAYGCGGHSYDMRWDKVKAFLETQDGDYDLTIDDLALFVTNEDGCDVSGYIRD